MTTFCEHFYPQVTKPIIKELLNSTEEEIRQMLQSPHTIQNKIEKNRHKIDFNPPYVSILRAPQHKANNQPHPNTSRVDPLQIIRLDAKIIKTKTMIEKIQTVTASIQLLLQD